jgi:hypothetical protein
MTTLRAYRVPLVPFSLVWRRTWLAQVEKRLGSSRRSDAGVALDIGEQPHNIA